MHHMMTYDMVWQRMVLTVIHWGYRSHIVKQSWLQKIQFIFITLYNQYGCVHHCIHLSSPSSHASPIYNSTSLEECRCRINMMGSRRRHVLGGAQAARASRPRTRHRAPGGAAAAATRARLSPGPAGRARWRARGGTRRRRWRRRANDEGAGVRGVGGCAPSACHRRSRGRTQAAERTQGSARTETHTQASAHHDRVPPSRAKTARARARVLRGNTRAPRLLRRRGAEVDIGELGPARGEHAVGGEGGCAGGEEAVADGGVEEAALVAADEVGADDDRGGDGEEEDEGRTTGGGRIGR